MRCQLKRFVFCQVCLWISTNNEQRDQVYWQLDIPPKCKTFMWLLVMDIILMNEARCYRGMTDDPTCSICHGAYEDRNHTFRLFNLVGPIQQQITNFQHNSISFNDWLKDNLTSGPKDLFVLILCHIWLWRCAKIFDPQFIYLASPIYVIKNYYQSWLESKAYQ